MATKNVQPQTPSSVPKLKDVPNSNRAIRRLTMNPKIVFFSTKVTSHTLSRRIQADYDRSHIRPRVESDPLTISDFDLFVHIPHATTNGVIIL